MGSKYSSIASRMLAKASSYVSPSLIQPGKEGTYTVKPPSSLGSKSMVSFIVSPLRGLTYLSELTTGLTPWATFVPPLRGLLAYGFDFNFVELGFYVRCYPGCDVSRPDRVTSCADLYPDTALLLPGGDFY